MLSFLTDFEGFRNELLLLVCLICPSRSKLSKTHEYLGGPLLYIYISATVPPRHTHRACLIQWHILQDSEEEGGRRPLL